MGKSYVTAAFVCWCLLRDPHVNILVVSASKQRADNFTTFVLRLIYEIPILQHLKPTAEQRCSKVSFDVAPAGASQSPSVESKGITGQLAGSRADIIIADDIEIPSNSATQMMRQKLAEAVKEFDAILKPNGQIIFLGTPQTEASIYNVLEERDYTPRVWPARYPTAEQVENYHGHLAPEIQLAAEKNPALVGHSVWASRFSDADLQEREKSYGRAGFALQFMLDTKLSDVDRYPLKLQDLLVTHLDPSLAPMKMVWANSADTYWNDLPVVGIGQDHYNRPVPIPNVEYSAYTGVVMAIDPSGRGEDETTYAVVASLNSHLFLLDAGGFQNGYDPSVLQKLAQAARKYGVNKVVIEANFGDGMFTQLLVPYLRAYHPCATEEVKHSKQKELRILDTLEPVMLSHRLVVDHDLIMRDWQSLEQYPLEKRLYYSLFFQLTRITRDRGALIHDDRLDALAMAVSHWVTAMAQDVDKNIKTHKDKLVRDELDRFMRHAIGAKPRKANWMGL